jgi:hypothetical protein
MKICTKCKQEKDESSFYVDRSHKDGLSYYCKDCARKRGRDFYHNNPNQKNKVVTRSKANRIVLKEYVVSYLKEHPCVDCGESDIRCLDFDHRSDKIKAISKILQESLSLNVLTNEIGKCDVRCANCHRKKTATDFNWYKNI